MQLLLIVVYTILISFTLSSIPGIGVLIAVSFLCNYFDLKEGYLILKPVASILASTGVILDIATSSFAATLIARQEKRADDVPAKEHI